ncbi:MAG TPA: protein kinase [Vicinamibacteria bacterium]|nr:protein kinase [Vicinamibacteria bacterium]
MSTAPTLLAGETLSHYRVLDRLGSGAMGEVFLAEDIRLRRKVALKTLRRDVQDAGACDRLWGEARAASALNHPGIATIYEIDEVARGEGNLRFFAMEYVAGPTLADFARREDIDLDAVLDVVMQVADALAAAHAQGFVHRDVKPTNVVVGEGRRVKLLDFGLAAPVLAGEIEATRTRGRPADPALVGTLAYMAPEQALGHEIDGRADLFSLGVVLYELVSGQHPFQGRNAVEVLDKVLHADPPPLRSRFDDPRAAALEPVVRRMLARDPSARYADLRGACADLGLVRRGAVLPEASGRASVAVFGFSNITKDGEDDWIGTGIAETVTADLKSVEGLSVVSRERVQERLRALAVEDVDEAAAVRVGRDVGARFVLTGGYQRAGEAIRVTARLLDTSGGAIVRTVKLDGRLDAIFDLQDRIVRELIAGLWLSLARGDRGGDETPVIEAFEAFTKGVINYRIESYETLDRATFLFERATRLDPAYARAWVELGSVLSSKAEYLAIPELHERALQAYRKALELRPGLVRAWREMGTVQVLLGRETEGVESIRRALELDPGDAGALAAMGRAHFIGFARFREAAGWYERALERNPQAGWYALQLAHCLALLRDFAPGETVAGRAIEMQRASLSGQENVRIVGSHMRLAHLLALQGRHAEAVEQLELERAFLEHVDHALRSRTVVELHMRLAGSLRALGRENEARAALETAVSAFEVRLRVGADDPFTRYYAAAAHAMRDETDEAIGALEKAAARRRAFTVARARIEPEWESLRDDERFLRLLGPAPGEERAP